MADLTLEFKNKPELKDKWGKEYSRGQFFVSSRVAIPLGAHRIYFRILSTDEVVALPINVQRQMASGNPQGPGVMVQLADVGAEMRGKIDAFFAGLEKYEWMGIKNFCPALEQPKPVPKGPTQEEENQKFLQDALRKAAKVVEAGKRTDHYGALGIDRAASKEEIRVAFVRQTRTFHPDNFSGEMLDDQTLALLEGAYQAANRANIVLKDKEKKRQYDLSKGLAVKARDESGFDLAVKRRELEHEQYKQKNREHVQKAERIFKDALVALREGDKKSALANVKIAATYDPFNSEYKDMLKKLETSK